MRALVRLSIAAALAVSVGFVWTVGQTGLQQTNRNLCDLWASLPLPAYQSCEFQNVLVNVWLGAAALAVIWLLIEFCRINAVRRQAVRFLKMIEPSHLIILGLVIALGGAIWQWRRTPPPDPKVSALQSQLSELTNKLADALQPKTSTTRLGQVEAVNAQSDAFVWDDHLGHSYSGTAPNIITQAFSIGATNNSGHQIRLEDAFVNSDHSGERLDLEMAHGADWIKELSTQVIETGTPVYFRFQFKQPTLASEVLRDWWPMTITLVHDGAPHKHLITEQMVRAVYASFRPAPSAAPSLPRGTPPSASAASYLKDVHFYSGSASPPINSRFSARFARDGERARFYVEDRYYVAGVMGASAWIRAPQVRLDEIKDFVAGDSIDIKILTPFENDGRKLWRWGPPTDQHDPKTTFQSAAWHQGRIVLRIDNDPPEYFYFLIDLAAPDVPPNVVGQERFDFTQ